MPGKLRFALEEFAIKTFDFAAKGSNTEVGRTDANTDKVQTRVH
jgi:hypothetical protein